MKTIKKDWEYKYVNTIGEQGNMGHFYRVDTQNRTHIDVWGFESTKEETEKIARLIVQAPKLLESLQKITHEFESLCNEVTFGDTLRESDFDLIHKAKATINKALGNENQ